MMVQGRLLLTIPREVADAERHVVGMPLAEPLYRRLCQAADEEAGYRTALRVLERRPFAARDLVRRLVLKGHPPSAAEAAVDRARRAGLVDDERFALHFVATRAARGRGPLRLRRDLACLGVDRSVVDRALVETLGPEGEEGPSIEGLARRRLAQLKGLPKPVQRRRVLAYLGRRGFVGRTAREALEAVLAGKA